MIVSAAITHELAISAVLASVLCLLILSIAASESAEPHPSSDLGIVIACLLAPVVTLLMLLGF